MADAGLLIRRGTVWAEHGSARADVRVEGERIAGIGELTPHDGEEILDADGLQVLPGLCDVHVHIDDRIGRFDLADTWFTASEIAVRNGITTLAGFVTQQPGETLTAAVERSLARAHGHSHCDLAFHLTPTGWPWNWDEIAALAARGFRTVKLYTTYREAGLFTSYERLGEVMPRLRQLGVRLLVHCEDDARLVASASAPVDLADPLSHTRLRPEAAEAEAVLRVIELAQRTGCPTHIVHVSTADGAAAVATARARGVTITCETAPHYLRLDARSLSGATGHRWLCTPPLRSPDTRARMEAHVVAGVVDLLATDHCAFRRTDKDDWHRDLRDAPFGIAGLGSLVPLTFELLVKRHGLTLAALVRTLAANPARLLSAWPRKGVIAVGADADLVILAADGPPRAVRSSLADCYETYPNLTTTLDVRYALVRGCVVLRDRELVAPHEFAGRPL